MNSKLQVEQAIANCLKQGVPYSLIADTFHISPKRISRINRQIKNNEPITPAKMGRPSKLTPEIFAKVESETFQDPTIGGRTLSRVILNSLNVELSETTINFIRKQLNFHFSSPRRRQFLTETQIEKRINFCQDQLQNKINWENEVVFSDESRFCLHDDSRRVWMKRGIYNEVEN